MPPLGGLARQCLAAAGSSLVPRARPLPLACRPHNRLVASRTALPKGTRVVRHELNVEAIYAGLAHRLEQNGATLSRILAKAS